ncbi:MAG: UDP-3-O-(3-hydroxymyristoyl)glucosamine N-acyltransferase [Chlamydiia bacterium]|nr:UDP-3-O-(3-hydroxymyristoyl)glucosamine N-acyltransferase [Chlamydiia bacterium]
MISSNIFTLKEIAELTQSELIGNPHHQITGVEDLESAKNSDASFLANPRYERQLVTSKAGVIFLCPTKKRPASGNFLLNQNPSFAFQQLIDALFPQEKISGFGDGIHPSAVIHESVEIGEHVTIGPFVVIDRGTKIGDYTTISPHISIGMDVVIGDHCFFHPHVTIRERTKIGNRVIIQPGARIGSCGFGYITDENGKHTSLRQVGIVILEDDVEIGANTTIDRARFKATIIHSGTKIDNLVQIAHQVEIGQDNLIVSQTGIAGSSKTGRNVVLAGQVGIIGHIELADNVILTARTAVTKSLKEAGVYTGVPAAPFMEYKRLMVKFRNLGQLEQRVRELESQLKNASEKKRSEQL